jgi:hypothetical protein
MTHGQGNINSACSYSTAHGVPHPTAYTLHLLYSSVLDHSTAYTVHVVTRQQTQYFLLVMNVYEHGPVCPVEWQNNGWEDP